MDWIDKIDCGCLVFSGKKDNIGTWYEKLVTKSIKSLTNSIWTHVAFLRKKDGKLEYLEATYPKVQKGDLFELLPEDRNYYIVVKIKNWDLIEYNNVFDSLIQSYEGKKYGIWQLIFSALAIIFRSKNLVRKGIVCSELVWCGFNRSSHFHTLLANYDKNKISPEEIWINIRAFSFANNLETIYVSGSYEIIEALNKRGKVL